jgi:hypothetical protein
MDNFAGSMTSVTSPSSLQWVMGGGILKREARPVPAPSIIGTDNHFPDVRKKMLDIEYNL